MSVIASRAGVTFPVDEVTPAPDRAGVAAPLDTLRTLMGSGVESVAPGADSLVTGLTYHPLIATVHLAFSQHRPLVLSPDMLWVTLLQGLSHHLALDPDRHRSLVHADAEPIRITVQSALAPTHDRAFWRGVVDELGRGVDRHSQRVRDLGAVRFSTTGPDELAASRIALLDAFQRYFDYEVMCVCGIPHVTLEGAPEDWLALRRAAEQLRAFDLDWWVDELGPLLDEMVRASAGSPDLAHWQNIYKLSDDYGESRMNGWFLKLIPYIVDSRTKNPARRNPLFASSHGFKASALPTGLSAAPVALTSEGATRTMQMVAGVIGATQDPRTGALRPRVGWAVREAPAFTGLLARLKTAHAWRRPLPADQRHALFDHYRQDFFPAELFELYAAMDGADLFASGGVAAYRLSSLAELLTGPEVAGDCFTRRDGWLPLATLPDGSRLMTLAYRTRWEGEKGVDLRPVVHAPPPPHDRVAGLPVISTSVAELIEDLLAGGGRYLLPGGPTKRLGRTSVGRPYGFTMTVFTREPPGDA